MIFESGEIPRMTEEQRKISNIALRENSERRKRSKSGPCITIYKAPEKIEQITEQVNSQETK